MPVPSGVAGRAAGRHVQLDCALVDVDGARDDAQRSLWLTAAALLLLGAVAAWLLARSLASPLVHLTVAARRISVGDYGPPTDARFRQVLTTDPRADEVKLLARAFKRMRERVADSTSALRRERDLLGAVLESTAEGIVMTAPAGEIVVANARWIDLVGEGSVTSESDLEHVDDRRPFGEVAAGWLDEQGRVAGADFERMSPRYARFRCYTTPVDHHDGAVVGRIFVLRDVTHETEVERQRSAFVATVSHELRAPLTVIQGYSETLLDDLDQGYWNPKDEPELVEIVRSSADTLGRMVENLLDAATLEAGVLRLQPEPVCVERLAERLVSRQNGLADNHDVHVDAAPGLPPALADPLRVEQVLTNLIDNAIKYSPDGGSVTVRIDGGGDEDELTISVRDHGLGLAIEQAERVFERFYRAGDPVGGAPRGVGLGLFLCKRLVEAQGGQIWVESTPGAGSTFTFTLPALLEPELSPETPPPSSVVVLDDAALPVGAAR